MRFVGLAPVRPFRPNMAVLYHVNGRLQRAYSDNTTITQAENNCKHCENPNLYKKLILNVQNALGMITTICLICDHQIAINIEHAKEGFIRCEDCGAITYDNFKMSDRTFYYPTQHEDQEEED